MTQFSYTIQDELGLHARPAGLLAKEAAKFKSTVTVESGAKKGDAKKIMSLMMLVMILMFLPAAQVSAQRINEVLDKEIMLHQGEKAEAKERSLRSSAGSVFKRKFINR